MNKDEVSMNLDDLDGVMVEINEGVNGNYLEEGSHLVTLSDGKFIYSNGWDGMVFADRARQIFFVATDADGKHIDMHITIDGHKRIDEVSGADLKGFKASVIGMTAQEIKDLFKSDPEKAVAAMCGSYTNHEGQEVAFRKDTMNRILDPVRSANAQARAGTLLHACGYPKGKVSLKEVPAKAEGKSCQIEVITSDLKNAKQRFMRKVDAWSNPKNSVTKESVSNEVEFDLD